MVEGLRSVLLELLDDITKCVHFRLAVFINPGVADEVLLGIQNFRNAPAGPLKFIRNYSFLVLFDHPLISDFQSYCTRISQRGCKAGISCFAQKHGCPNAYARLHRLDGGVRLAQGNGSAVASLLSH